MTRCTYCDMPITGSPVRGSDGEGTYCCHGCLMAHDADRNETQHAAAECPACCSGKVAPEPSDTGVDTLLYRLIGGALFAVFIMVLSLAVSTRYGFGALQTLSHDVSTAHWILLAASIPALLLLGIPVVKGAWQDLKEKRLTLHVLFTLGAASATVVSLASYIRGAGPVYLETAVMLLALFTVGRYLEARAKNRTTRVLRSLLRVPTQMYERIAPTKQEVAPEEIREDDWLRIQPGNVFPVDGEVLTGESFVDESSLTGESRPVRREAGEPVYAGTKNLDGLLTVRVTATGERRRLARIEATMQNAMAQPSALTQQTNRVLQWLIPGVVGLALLTFGGWYLAAGYERALYAALSVVLIACPCALGLAIPLAHTAAIGTAARHGVLFRSGEVLHKLRDVGAVLFDKTGTLSKPEKQEIQVRPLATQGDGAPVDDQRLLQLVAALEAQIDHPLARAIAAAVPAGPTAAHAVTAAKTIPGAGVVGSVVEGEREVAVGIGNEALLHHLNATPSPTAGTAPHVDRMVDEIEAEGRTPLFITIDGAAVALLVIEETMAPEAVEALRELEQLDLTVHVATGDREAAGRRAGVLLDTVVHAGLSPDEKVAMLHTLRRSHGAVAVVGDGVNDAAAMAHADVGFALTSGAELTVDAADIALYNSDLRNVGRSMRLAIRTDRVVRQNLAWTALYNTVGLGLAVAGLLHPIAAVAIMIGSSALVTWNALRLRRGWKDGDDAAVTGGSAAAANGHASPPAATEETPAERDQATVAPASPTPPAHPPECCAHHRRAPSP
jgi:heavy metal translocating P-type ATPase